MSLRELPPGQTLPPRSTLRGRLRYVPLVLLMVIALMATIGGIVVRRQLVSAPPPAPSLIDLAPVAGTDTSGSVPAVCRPPVEPPAQEPWIEGDASQAEAVWQAHLGEMTGPFVVGLDGYVDWDDDIDLNLSQAVGRRALSNTEVQAWADYLQSVQTELAALDIPLYIVVGPQKWAVYPEKMPEWAQQIRGSGPLDQLLASHPELPIVDVRGALREASEQHPVYSRVNSHWTDYGSQIGWEVISGCINAMSPELTGVSALTVDGVTIGPDLSEFATYGVDNPEPDWTIPSYEEELLPVTITRADGSVATVDGMTRTGLTDLPVDTSTPGAPSDASLLLVRDSMSDSLSIQVQQAFAKTWQRQHYFFDPANVANVVQLAKELDPDVVILEFAQRYLNNPAPAPLTQDVP